MLEDEKKGTVPFMTDKVGKWYKLESVVYDFEILRHFGTYEDLD